MSLRSSFVKYTDIIKSSHKTMITQPAEILNRLLQTYLQEPSQPTAQLFDAPSQLRQVMRNLSTQLSSPQADFRALVQSAEQQLTTLREPLPEALNDLWGAFYYHYSPCLPQPTGHFASLLVEAGDRAKDERTKLLQKASEALLNEMRRGISRGHVGMDQQDEERLKGFEGYTAILDLISRNGDSTLTDADFLNLIDGCRINAASHGYLSSLERLLKLSCTTVERAQASVRHIAERLKSRELDRNREALLGFLEYAINFINDHHAALAIEVQHELIDAILKEGNSSAIPVKDVIYLLTINSIDPTVKDKIYFAFLQRMQREIFFMRGMSNLHVITLLNVPGKRDQTFDVMLETICMFDDVSMLGWFYRACVAQGQLTTEHFNRIIDGFFKVVEEKIKKYGVTYGVTDSDLAFLREVDVPNHLKARAIGVLLTALKNNPTSEMTNTVLALVKVSDNSLLPEQEDLVWKAIKYITANLKENEKRISSDAFQKLCEFINAHPQDLHPDLLDDLKKYVAENGDSKFCPIIVNVFKLPPLPVKVGTPQPDVHNVHRALQAQLDSSNPDLSDVCANLELLSGIAISDKDCQALFRLVISLHEKWQANLSVEQIQTFIKALAKLATAAADDLPCQFKQAASLLNSLRKCLDDAAWQYFKRESYGSNRMYGYTFASQFQYRDLFVKLISRFPTDVQVGLISHAEGAPYALDEAIRKQLVGAAQTIPELVVAEKAQPPLIVGRKGCC